MCITLTLVSSCFSFCLKVENWLQYQVSKQSSLTLLISNVLTDFSQTAFRGNFFSLWWSVILKLQWLSFLPAEQMIYNSLHCFRLTHTHSLVFLGLSSCFCTVTLPSLFLPCTLRFCFFSVFYVFKTANWLNIWKVMWNKFQPFYQNQFYWYIEFR